MEASDRLFREQRPSRHCARCGRSRRDHERRPRIPAIGPVLRGKFLVAFEIEVTLHLADGKNESDLRADTDHLRLEASDAIAGAAVATDFLVKVALVRPYMPIRPTAASRQADSTVRGD